MPMDFDRLCSAVVCRFGSVSTRHCGTGKFLHENNFSNLLVKTADGSLLAEGATERPPIRATRSRLQASGTTRGGGGERGTEAAAGGRRGPRTAEDATAEARPGGQRGVGDDWPGLARPPAATR